MQRSCPTEHLCFMQKICGSVSMLPTSHQQDDSSDFEVALALILDLLFFANSRPLHRQVLSWCRSLPVHKFAAIPPLLVARAHKAVAASNCKGPEMQPIAFAEPLLSLLEFKPLQMPLRRVQLILHCLIKCIHDQALADVFRPCHLLHAANVLHAHTSSVASLLIQC